MEIFAEKGKKKIKPCQNNPSEAPRRSTGGENTKFFLGKRWGNRDKKYYTETTGQKLTEAVDSKVKRNTKETLFNMLFPHVIPIEDLKNVHHE